MAVVAYTAEAPNASDVWIYDFSHAAAPRRLTFSGRSAFSGVVRRQCACGVSASRRGGDAGIFWQRADGSGSVERLTKAEDGVVQVPESFSPLTNGCCIGSKKVRGTRCGPCRCAIVPLNRSATSSRSDSQPRRLSHPMDDGWRTWLGERRVRGGVRPAISSDRHQVSTPADATRRRDDAQPLWSHDGTTLAYNSGPGLFATVRVTGRTSTLTFGTPTVVARATRMRVGGAQLRTWDLMPDGRTMVSVINPNASQSSAAVQLNVVLNWFETLKTREPAK